MTERRRRVEELLDAEIAKGGSGMDCHIRACMAFADAEVAAERERNNFTAADCAELQYWRRQNEDMMHYKHRTDSRSHYDQICDIRGRFISKGEPHD